MEENPFEDKQGAEEWIHAVENERGTIRDNEIYPQLTAWVKTIKPPVIVDIGAGQGICSTKLGIDDTEYIGIEPSKYLVARANQLYKKDGRKFLIGSAYNIPLESNIANAVFSITTWFHLADTSIASRELARILKSEGRFMIITPNPEAYDVWRTFYSDLKKDGKLLVGKVDILLNPTDSKKNFKFSRLSKKTFYLHSLEDMINPLKKAGLQVDSIEKMGFTPLSPNRPIFVKILGHKI